MSLRFSKMRTLTVMTSRLRDRDVLMYLLIRSVNIPDSYSERRNSKIANCKNFLTFHSTHSHIHVLQAEEGIARRKETEDRRDNNTHTPSSHKLWGSRRSCVKDRHRDPPPRPLLSVLNVNVKRHLRLHGRASPYRPIRRSTPGRHIHQRLCL